MDLPEDVNAISLFFDKAILIAKKHSEKEKYFFLIHEQTHFDHPGSFYSLFKASKSEVNKKEKFIDRLTIEKAIPVARLYELAKSGMSIDEISDEIGIPERIIQEAYKLYQAIGKWPANKEVEENACI